MHGHVRSSLCLETTRSDAAKQCHHVASTQRVRASHARKPCPLAERLVEIWLTKITSGVHGRT
jgi:hypothetical protein